MKVLIADDNKQMRDFIRNLLLRHISDLELIECSDGDEAVRLQKEHCPDLILMDIMMQRLDGLSAIRLIHKTLSTQKVIVLSQLPAEDYEEEAVLAGASKYLSKENLDRLPELINDLFPNKYSENNNRKL